MSPRSIRRAAERQAAKHARKLTQNPKQSEAQAQPKSEKHALTGNFRLLQSESQEAFDELRTLLRSEHAPTTPTESLLVDRMVEHIWLSQRADRFQNEAARDGKESWFALMLRERRQNSGEQFESQNAKRAASTPPTDAPAAEIELQNSPKPEPGIPHAAPAPGSFRKNGPNPLGTTGQPSVESEKAAA